MICYRDRSFCSRSGRDCHETACLRYISDDMEKHAAEIGLPICFSDFSTWCGKTFPKKDQINED